MTLRRDRTHTNGLSNIDFRTKNDTESLRLFQPWTTTQGFGTMGNAWFTRPRKEKEHTIEVTNKINKQKHIAAGFPDPRTFQTAKFYSEKHIKLNTKNIISTERIAQLDENFKGKERFTGDSMMIGEVNKIRKSKKPRKPGFDDPESKKKQAIQSMIIEDKSIKNKEAIQETQLVKLKVEETLLNKVDISKLKEIRLALRRRYANRTQLRKIFKEWDESNTGEISVYDAYNMINNFSIPININETRVLIASSNTRNTETLNMKEFMHMIFSDNEALNVDLSKLKVVDEKFYDESAQNDLKRKMHDNIADMSKTEEMNTLKAFIRVRLPAFVKKIIEGNEGMEQNSLCDYEKFRHVIKQFPIMIQCSKEPVIRALYDLYSNKEGLFDCRLLCENLLDKQTEEPFAAFKDNLLQFTVNKMNANNNELREMIKDNADKIKMKDLSYLQAQINEKARLKKIEDEKELYNERKINNAVPSTEFIKQLFGKSQQSFHKMRELESEFSAHPSLLKEMRPQTRYGANPAFKNTAEIIQMPISAPGYINEESRFKVRGNDLTDFVDQEKQKRSALSSARIERIRNQQHMKQSHIDWTDYLIEEKIKYSDLQKTKMKFGYEVTIKKQNEFIE